MKIVKIKNAVAILVGSAIAGFGLNYFTIANGLGEGGFTGIAVLLKYLFDFSPGITSLFMNIPLFFLGWFLLGREAMIYTVWGTICLSFFMWLFEDWGTPLKGDLLLAALYAGVSVGLGLGIIFRFGGTTGGSDIIARLVNRYWGVSIGQTMFTFDVFVILTSLFYIGRERAMYTLISVFLAAKVIDLVQQGMYAGKAVMIFSDQAEVISRMIIEQLDRGATLLKGRGGYTGKERDVLYVVVSRVEVVRLKSLIRSVDPHAFVVFSDANDVLGEGFYLEETKS